ncbi:MULTISPECIES: ArsR/SmtB family transcription factor [Paenibacillus]|uniref:Transcriptional regulator n=2 Tax=Paenibacillus TaxID=44249 RepID=A0A1V4HIA5_9BACL|nr:MULTISPECIES: metalloregulator ArsR/SmtB family transcription factor [Paenibacillus]MEC0228090.1 metalloregulator ArsR/SmtB family transcription factor [Paenibacillus alba]NQX66835.1 helix-turn-helix transcriptional regulator [Paenibacillus alba]OPH56620.1 transcriptional regulator [Paenibacillus ferrarius]
MRPLFHPAPSDLELSTILHALSDEIRLHVIKRLHEQGELICGAIEIDIPKSTLSHHLKVLRESGLIHTRMDGTLRHISLRREDLQARFPGLLDTILTLVNT